MNNKNREFTSNILGLLVLAGFLLITGCSSVPITKINTEMKPKLEGKSFVVLSRKPEFAFKPGLTGQAFNMDAPSWLYGQGKDGNLGLEIMSRFKIQNPQERLVNALSTGLQKKYGMILFKPSAQDPAPYYNNKEELDRLIAHYRTKVDHIVRAWGQVESGNTFNFSRYAHRFFGRFSLKNYPQDLSGYYDDDASLVIFNDMCGAGHDQAKNPQFPVGFADPFSYDNIAPTYVEMLDDDAKLLKQIIYETTDRCAQYFLSEGKGRAVGWVSKA